MKSEYLYGVVIVIVLLIVLFVYNMMSNTTITTSPPSGGTSANANTTKTNTNTNITTTMNVNYTLAGGASIGTLGLYVINSTTVSSTTNIGYESNSVTGAFAGSKNGSSTPLYYIQYDGTRLNFIVNTSPLSMYSLANLSTYKMSVTDTDPSHQQYNVSTAKVNENVLTLTNGSFTLTITLPNNFS